MPDTAALGSERRTGDVHDGATAASTELSIGFMSTVGDGVLGRHGFCGGQWVPTHAIHSVVVTVDGDGGNRGESARGVTQGAINSVTYMGLSLIDISICMGWGHTELDICISAFWTLGVLCLMVEVSLLHPLLGMSKFSKRGTFERVKM